MASAAIPQLITAADVTIVARARVSKVLDTLFERNLLLTARPWAVLRLQPFLSQYDKDVKVLHDKGKQASLCQLYSWPESLGPVNEDIRGRFVAAVLRETKKQLKQKGYEIVALQHKPESLTPASSTASERQVGPGSAAALCDADAARCIYSHRPTEAELLAHDTQLRLLRRSVLLFCHPIDTGTSWTSVAYSASRSTACAQHAAAAARRARGRARPGEVRTAP